MPVLRTLDLAGARANPTFLHPSATIALPRAGGAERDALVVSHGQAAATDLSADLARYGPWAARLQAASGTSLYGEYTEGVGNHRATVGVLGRSGGGRVMNLAVFRGSFVPESEDAAAPAVPADGQERVLRYLRSLEAGRTAEALACFSPHGVYSIPPRTPEGARITVHGHQEIENIFAARGTNEARHVVQDFATVDGAGYAIIAGEVSGLPGRVTSTFMSSVTFGKEGGIVRYVARITIPALPWPMGDVS